MKPVNQKVIDANEGDCLGACIASILEIEAYPNYHTTDSGSWLDNWNKYLRDFNLQIIEYPLGSFPVPNGYAILAVKSALFQGVRHAVVFHGDGYTGEVIHNPNPNDPRGINIQNSDWLSFKVLALIDPAKMGEFDKIKALSFGLKWHRYRWEVLQKYQKYLPEPFRTEVCDILANGSPRSVGGTTPRALDLPSASAVCKCFVSIESYNNCPVHGTANQ